MHRLTFFLSLILTVLLVVSSPAQTVSPLTVDTVAAGLSQPVYVTAAPGDSTRLFILEKSGRIRVLHNGTLLTDPFLDVSDLMVIQHSEQGLLGMAFHPEYESNGYFFINYTDISGDTRVVRYRVSPDPDSADVSSATTILTVDQPYGNHNAGMLAFGPTDGYLYIGLGDGGSGGDPGNRAQDPTTLLGKMLRIDVNGSVPYSVPPDNPYASSVDTLPEIWAFGLRNPWRYSFDRLTGDLYIADVGQNEIEEVGFQPAGSGGLNHGWRLKEGSSCYEPPSGCDTLTGLTDPIHEYTHGGTPFRCSVTGGYVYRGCAVTGLEGTYFFGDFCSGQVWSFRYDGSTLSDFQDRTAELGLSSAAISSFGQDNQGELYIVDMGGYVIKIVPDGPTGCAEACCQGIRGNTDGDGTESINVADLTFLVDYLFKGGPAPACEAEANADGASAINVADLTYLVEYLFKGGPPPPDCP